MMIGTPISTSFVPISRYSPLTEINLRIQILRQLLDAHALNRELRPRDIKEVLWSIAKNGLEEDTFRIQILRELGRLEGEGLILGRKVTRADGKAKETFFSIKNEIGARLIITADSFGWDLSRKPKSFRIPILISAKTYKEMVQKLSKDILDAVLLREAFPVYADTRSPGPIVFPVPVPLSQAKGNLLRDQILVMVPDGISATKIETFTEERYKDFLEYLTDAWVLYFEEVKITRDNIVIIHFTNPQAERLRRIVALGGAKSVDEVVHRATSHYLNTYDPSKKHFSVKADSPIIKMSIKRGMYKSNEEFVEAAIKEHEQRLAQELLETVE